MSAPDEQTAGQSLTLECRITAVKDIDSTVDIIWTTGSTEVRRVENIPACLISNYSDFFTTPVLSINDNNREYQCEVIINISPPVTEINKVTLNVTRKFNLCMFCLHTVKTRSYIILLNYVHSIVNLLQLICVYNDITKKSR